MSKRLEGLLNLTKIGDAVKSGAQVIDGKKGKYIGIDVWLEDQPDQYGNEASIKLYNKATGERIYISNLKVSERETPTQTEAKDLDLPF